MTTAKAKQYRIKGLKVSKVALVPAGANPDAEIVLFKAAPLAKDMMGYNEPSDMVEELADALVDEMAEETMPEPLPLTTDERLAAQAAYEAACAIDEAFLASLWEILDALNDGGDAGILGPLLVRSVQEYVTQLGADPLAKSVVMKANAMARLFKAGMRWVLPQLKTLQKAVESFPDLQTQLRGNPPGKGTSMVDENVDGAVATRLVAAEAQVEELKAALAKALQTPEELEAIYLASLPDSVRKAMADDQIEKAALRAELAQERGLRAQASYVTKTRDYQSLGFTTEDWTVLQALDTLDPGVTARVYHLLKANAAQAQRSPLLKAVGFDGGDVINNAGERISALAKERAAASSGKLSYEQAYDAVMTEQPQLLQQYRAEQRG